MTVEDVAIEQMIMRRKLLEIEMMKETVETRRITVKERERYIALLSMNGTMNKDRLKLFIESATDESKMSDRQRMARNKMIHGIDEVINDC